MEKDSTGVTVETETLTSVTGTGIQTKFKPGHKRSGSDVIESIGKESVFIESHRSSTSEKLNIQAEFQSTRRRSSDVVDCIGHKHREVDMETKMTEVDGAVGGVKRPTTLDMKPEVSMEWNQEGQAWTTTDRSSKEVTDATPSTPLEPSNSHKDDFRCIAVDVEMPVAWDADKYNMQHKRRGHAVIFNHDTFDHPRDYKHREGSQIDVKNLQEAFSSLLFDVTIHNNLEYLQIKEVISALAEEDHSDADCLAIIVMTHGKENGLLVPRDSSVCYNVDMLWKPFTADKCPTLAGKPKLFFIQACRGREFDAGIKMKQQRGRRTESDSSPSSSYKIPTHADFLVAYSTMEGFYSFRNQDTGSWFIQSLCKELNSTDNLLQILTRTTWRVTQLESDTDEKQSHEQKQVPSITSMLTRDLYFHP